MSLLSLYEIAQDWSIVTNQDSNYFKKTFYNRFPNVSPTLMAMQLSRPGGGEKLCKCALILKPVKKYWIVLKDNQEEYFYTIDSNNKFEKETIKKSQTLNLTSH